MNNIVDSFNPLVDYAILLIYMMRCFAASYTFICVWITTLGNLLMLWIN